MYSRGIAFLFFGTHVSELLVYHLFMTYIPHWISVSLEYVYLSGLLQLACHTVGEKME